MAKPLDALTRAYAPDARIQLVLANVADAARALEQNHLCGPTASLVLAEALAGVALLGSELTEPGETVTLHMRVAGPMRGLLVEAAQDGGLRGYPYIKVLNDLDAREELDTDEALGDRAEVKIVRSLPGRVLAHAAIELQPAAPRLAIERFYALSMQRRAAVQLTAVAYDDTLELARGLMAVALPDVDLETYARVAARFEDDTIADELESCGTLVEFGALLGLDDLRLEAPRPLRFACRCSAEKVADMLAALPRAELAALANAGKATAVFCHMCGRQYEATPEQITRILEQRPS